ncbi:intracellular iron chaperone frataxin [Clostridium zeae]|uniref:Intracellular iron chaperone frataxin n=1 Tax=Clostridium zeae TaxID=2759022 RepID=A0ABQ1E5Y1_9CLOT|nr:iron chaperone [Clostridium zeae]GFZ30150.1 intracellular iron chaperone frataxin [Clostridium zeae]
MEVFQEYLDRINDTEKRARVEELLTWITKRFPSLVPRIAWSQPMFTDHGTFIIGFSVAKNHLAFSPEKACLNRFLDEVMQAGYSNTKELIRIPWDSQVDFSLFEKMIEFNIMDKMECSTFWRK